jgi:carbon storage regulator
MSCQIGLVSPEPIRYNFLVPEYGQEARRFPSESPVVFLDEEDPLNGEWLFSPIQSSPCSGRESTMLVLTRQPGQKIVLPSLGITVQVLSIKGGRVRIGIVAPPAVSVVREELLSADRQCGKDLESEPVCVSV